MIIFMSLLRRERERESLIIEKDIKWNYNGIVKANMQGFYLADYILKHVSISF